MVDSIENTVKAKDPFRKIHKNIYHKCSFHFEKSVNSLEGLLSP